MAEFDWEKYSDIIKDIKFIHGDQIRKFTKMPYYLHPVRVANLVMKFKNSHKLDELVIAALCHDIVEDTKTDLGYISDMYGDLVASLVGELTCDFDEQHRLGKVIYLSEKMTKMSSWALVLKLCDRLENVTDFVFAPNSWINKYGIETFEILYRVTIAREGKFSDPQNNIMNEINRILTSYTLLYELWLDKLDNTDFIKEVEAWRISLNQ